MLRPDYKEFSRLAGEATLVPVVKSVAADLLTPVSAFLAIAAHEPDAFLLESVERGEQIGRYTFLGARPYMQVRARGKDIVIQRGKKTEKRQGSAIQVIKELLRQHRPAAVPGLPRLPRARWAISRMTQSGSWKISASMPRMISRCPIPY